MIRAELTVRVGPARAGVVLHVALPGSTPGLSAPRVRGWSSSPNASLASRSVGPARAGVVLGCTYRNNAPTSRPRACGGGPTWYWSSSDTTMSAPRVRGWSVARVDDAGELVVGPARAGVVLPPGARNAPTRRRPRACGGGPTLRGFFQRRGSSAPRVRGWSAAVRSARLPRRVGPARAGVVRGCPFSSTSPPSRPRACGGGPKVDAYAALTLASAPRVRGWSGAAAQGPHGGLVGPARAGVVPGVSACPTRVTRRPRACGGGPDIHRARGPPRPSAPRVRGWSCDSRRRPRFLNVGPARAGVVRRLPCRRYR